MIKQKPTANLPVTDDAHSTAELTLSPHVETEPAAITVNDSKALMPLVLERLRDFVNKSNSDATRRAYRVTMEQFQIFLRNRGKNIVQATPADVLAFRDGLIHGPKPLKPASVTLRLAALRSFYKYLHLAGLVPINPADTRLVTPPPPPEMATTNALSPKEVRMLLGSPDRKEVTGARDYVVLLLLARLALRAAEVCSLRNQDIVRVSARDVRGRSINWVIRVRVKGGRERKLPLPDDVKTAIEDYLKLDDEMRRLTKGLNPDAALIQRTGMGRTLGGKPLTTRALWNIVNKYAEYVGLEQVHPHSFRHTAITRALDMGLSYRDVQMMTGHKTLLTVQRYDAHREDMSRNAINELNYEEE